MARNQRHVDVIMEPAFDVARLFRICYVYWIVCDVWGALHEQAISLMLSTEYKNKIAVLEYII